MRKLVVPLEPHITERSLNSQLECRAPKQPHTRLGTWDGDYLSGAQALNVPEQGRDQLRPVPDGPLG